jgi:hypothetical protein
MPGLTDRCAAWGDSSVANELSEGIVVATAVEESPAAVVEDTATDPQARADIGHPPQIGRKGDDESPHPPVRWREIVAVVLVVALADLVIYRGQGFAGYAALFAAVPVLFVLGSPAPRYRWALLLVAGMLVLLSVRTVWLGSGLGVAVGFVLLVAFAVTIAGRHPYMLDIAAHAATTVAGGFRGLFLYALAARRGRPGVRAAMPLALLLPLAALLLFGGLFILANPDLVTGVVEMADRVFATVTDWIDQYAPNGWEIVFWIVVAWVAIGLLRPVMRRSVLAALEEQGPSAEEIPEAIGPAPLYVAVRNTLVAVIGLFAVYLAFEFSTLWFRNFPPGFYYAGYAHEGAAWLTVALALATVVLSLIFRGQVLRDPRLPRLRRLAWVWSAANLLLAIAVYHRLFIYIGFNGMTRLRTVALFGISVVVAGFMLVVWKVARKRDFVWLVNRHLWALAITIYLFALTPVDAIVHAYNVRRVLAGDPAPAVQIDVHPIDAEGLLVLRPLVRSKNQTIRHGIRALLAERALALEENARKRDRQGWTAYQAADQMALEHLRAVRSDWKEYVDPKKRKAASEQFHEYVWQWY